jgi:hypothetical protein
MALAFKGKRNGFFITGSQTLTILMDNEYDNTGGFSNSIFKVPVDGIYHFDALTTQIVTSSISQVTISAALELAVNSSMESQTIQSWDKQNLYENVQLSTDLKLSKGNTVELRLNNPNSGIQILVRDIRFSGQFVGTFP